VDIPKEAVGALTGTSALMETAGAADDETDGVGPGVVVVPMAPIRGASKTVGSDSKKARC